MSVDTAAETPSHKQPKRRLGRILAMLALPLVLLAIGGYVWVTGGRYVSTENAYVQQDKVTIGPDVSGRIISISVQENQKVEAGQVLFQIDPEPYQIALAQAEASLASARLKIEQLRAAYEDSRAELVSAEQDMEFRQREYTRQETLAKGGYTAQVNFDDARHELQLADQRLIKARQGVLSAAAALGGDPQIETDRHPIVEEAISLRDKARLDLRDTTVNAPAAGVISQTDRLQVGQYFTTGAAALSLVKADASWVEANFKETDLTNMRIGQSATIELDAYPDSELHARVESIGAGTGSEFSLLPAQNATGNWVKVVQRVPVRLSIDTTTTVPLRTGLSATVTVDTR